MRYLILLAIVVAATAMPAGDYAEAAKKVHKPRYYDYYGYAPEARPPSASQPQWGWGLGAAGGNNANSMYGSNSAVNNPIGRTSGGRGM